MTDRRSGSIVTRLQAFSITILRYGSLALDKQLLHIFIYDMMRFRNTPAELPGPIPSQFGCSMGANGRKGNRFQRGRPQDEPRLNVRARGWLFRKTIRFLGMNGAATRVYRRAI